MNTYDKQAIDFLKATRTTMNSGFLRHGKYFEGDKESRNIYWFSLATSKGVYSGTFGASLVDTKEGKKPSAYDILACLDGYAPGSFEEFCSDYGYDADSRAAERTYKAVVEQFEGLQSIYSEEELDQLSEIN